MLITRITRHAIIIAIVSALAFTAGCGDSSSPTDTGVTDAPQIDGPSPDGTPDGPSADVVDQGVDQADDASTDAPAMTTIVGQVQAVGCAAAGVTVQEQGNPTNNTITGGDGSYLLNIPAGAAVVIEAVSITPGCFGVLKPLKNLPAGTFGVPVNLLMIHDSNIASTFPTVTQSGANGIVVFEFVKTHANTGNESATISNPTGLGDPWAFNPTTMLYEQRPNNNLFAGPPVSELRGNLLFYLNVPPATAAYSLGGTECINALALGDAPVVPGTLTQMPMACVLPVPGG